MEQLLRQVWTNESAKNESLKKYVTLDDVYVALGHEDLQVEQVMIYLLPHLQRYDLSLFDGAKVAERHNGYAHHRMSQESADGEHVRSVTLAQCCCPIPGDPITGLFTPGKGILVHRSDCRLLLKRRNSRSKQKSQSSQNDSNGQSDKSGQSGSM